MKGKRPDYVVSVVTGGAGDDNKARWREIGVALTSERVQSADGSLAG